MPLNFSLDPFDIQHALRKWDGRDEVVENGRHVERRWHASDREFYEALGRGRIDETILARFAAKNSNNDPQRRTGGYSVIRNFWGGAAYWASPLQGFFRDYVAPARARYAASRDGAIGYELVIRLAKMKGRSPSGNSKPLGPVAASKLIFFACPEMPIHIYDSVVAKVFSMENLEVGRFPEWCRRCQSVMPKYAATEQLLPADRIGEFADKMDWFTRRCQDLMLYRVGGGAC